MRYDINIQKGDCYDLEVSYEADGDPVDLTGWSAELGFAWGPKGPLTSGQLVFSTDTGHVAALGNDGKVVVSLGSEDTNSINRHAFSGGYPVTYQLRLTQPDGCKSTLLAGSAILSFNHFEDAE